MKRKREVSGKSMWDWETELEVDVVVQQGGVPPVATHRTSFTESFCMFAKHLSTPVGSLASGLR